MTKISLCQIHPKIGDLDGNANIIKEHYLQAEKDKADICIFPELALSGYLAEDLFFSQDFLNDIKKYTEELVAISGDCCLLIPTPIVKNNLLYNGVIAAKNGKIIGETYKEKLPNYGVFDEKRYFASGKAQIISINGFKLGIAICEDVWSDSVCNELKAQGAELLISVNASPFETNKMEERIDKITQIFSNTKIPIIYCNQIAAQDGIIFDGKSFCFDGTLNIIGKAFEENTALLELANRKFNIQTIYSETPNINEDIYNAMVMGTKSYVRENGFSKVILGLSGGLDSAMVASIAVDALGSGNVSAIMLPSKFTSIESLNDANSIASNLKIPLKTISINDAVESLAKTIDQGKTTDETSIMYQNLQSRIRGTILMAESNKSGALLLTTGNKSEYATGYATIYGDMNGAFNPIKDIYKTKLFELAHYKNIIPKNIIEKEPSAELTPNQKDSDSLPKYEILDQILEHHFEKNWGQEELCKLFNPPMVKQVLTLIKNSEFKRRQSAPGVKISSKNFEKDRRFPITNHYK